MAIRLAEIGERLPADGRLLRYLVEQGLVNGVAPDRLTPGRGSPRALTQKQARRLALAAVLHRLGLRGDAFQSVLKAAEKAATNRVSCTLRDQDNGTAVTVTVDLRAIHQRL